MKPLTRPSIDKDIIRVMNKAMASINRRHTMSEACEIITRLRRALDRAAQYAHDDKNLCPYQMGEWERKDICVNCEVGLCDFKKDYDKMSKDCWLLYFND